MVVGQPSCEDEPKVDRISPLPDDILVSIISLLSLKEATATSILSRRWRYLRTRNLDLDGSDSLLELIENYCSNLDEKRRDYINWVDKIIAAMDESSTLDEFRVFFTLDRSYSSTIDQWLRFALSREVQKLDLNLMNCGGMDLCDRYIFPAIHEKFKFLKKISTNNVGVSGESVQQLIQICRHIQHLSLRSSDLKWLEIANPSPSLACLEIGRCYNLTSLVIRDSSIAILKVATAKVQHAVFENVPLLRELWCRLPDMTMEDFHQMFQKLLPQLRVLRLIIRYQHNLSHSDILSFRSTMMMSNLKQLVVVVDDLLRSGLNSPSWPVEHMDHLIRACPNLESLVVVAPQELDGENCNSGDPPAARLKKERARKAGRRKPGSYPRLKELKIVGYRDMESQFAMVMHLVKNAVALRNIVLDPAGVVVLFESFEYLWEFIPRRECSWRIHNMALELANYLPPRLNIKVIAENIKKIAKNINIIGKNES